VLGKDLEWLYAYIGGLFIARMMPPMQHCVCLLYMEELWTNLKFLSDRPQMDLMCRCLVSVSGIMCGSGLLASKVCRFLMVVCMPRVLKVSARRLRYV
jgi:hypothetical protein